jgi:hypothetical protein
MKKKKQKDEMPTIPPLLYDRMEIDCSNEQLLFYLKGELVDEHDLINAIEVYLETQPRMKRVEEEESNGG